MLSVSVKPRARQEKVDKLSEAEYVVWVRAPAHEGRANEAVIALLAKHLAVPKSSLRIVRGEKTRRKIIEIA